MYGLFDVDEGFYGAVTAEMNRRGEWITPLYNGHPWFEKPILLYWLAKPSLMFFGQAVGPRLPGIVCMLGVYALVGWFARRRLSEEAAQLAVLMLASSLLVVGIARMMLTDAPLLLCLTGALLTFWESLVDRRAWRLGTAALLGLGVLAKGPVALILFALIAGWTYWREPQLRATFKGFWAAGTALLALIVVSWYLPAYMASGRLFVREFLIQQNIGRFTGGDAAHTLPGLGGLITGILMYVGVVLVGMLPWSLFLWKAWPRRRPQAQPDKGDETGGLRTDPHSLPPFPFPEKRERGSEALERYLAAWVAVVFIFFAVSGAKLPHYLLPLFPLAVLLVAAYAVRSSKHLSRWFYAAGACCFVVAAAADSAFLWWYGASGQAEAQAIARYVHNVGGNVAVYQMGRREKDLGTGKPKLQETALPSLLMVLDKNVLDTDDFQSILRAPSPIWIITRSNRIQPVDYITAQRAGKQLVEIIPPVREDAFKLYLVR